jgi:hypothetical protein
VTVKRVEEMESICGGSFVRARASLGATSFGMNIWNFPPNWEEYSGWRNCSDPAASSALLVYGASDSGVRAHEMAASATRWRLELEDG